MVLKSCMPIGYFIGRTAVSAKLFQFFEKTKKTRKTYPMKWSGKIIIGTDVSNHQINYGLSNALRTLHDSGIIKLEHILDSSDIWNLHPLKAHPISGTVTNVTIL